MFQDLEVPGLWKAEMSHEVENIGCFLKGFVISDWSPVSCHPLPAPQGNRDFLFGELELESPRFRDAGAAGGLVEGMG